MFYNNSSVYFFKIDKMYFIYGEENYGKENYLL